MYLTQINTLVIEWTDTHGNTEIVLLTPEPDELEAFTTR